MNANLLKVNDDKMVALALASSNNQKKYNITMIKSGDCDIIPHPSAYDIGVAFDAEMPMVCHVQHICCTAYYHLRNIATNRSCLTEKAKFQIIHSLVIARLDYANVFLFGIPDFLITKLQRVQNSTVGLVVRCNRREHITPVQVKFNFIHLRTSPTCSMHADLRMLYVPPTTTACLCRHLPADTAT